MESPPHLRRVVKPWGWELYWTPSDLPYVGKILHIHAGARLSLQVHELKTESWLLISGRAKVLWEEPGHGLVETMLTPGHGYTCEAGRKHRLIGITECAIVEVSTREEGVTRRFEDDYGRANQAA